ncbi:hypothetical protein LOTGIDRAFT_165401 [Lottia gigantea]|uniref:Uncharacterized protein n=1 Tax=Lottia gigantea TaxID=225164 RepID=V3ZW60_LOTGI|nr:hypothetical protein LOTGIDRAFT_165401 [Lottia gigantea]ESO88617.1 hypothetical protein LOTGIDRAFT_165401 [Lottia gigantea]
MEVGHIMTRASAGDPLLCLDPKLHKLRKSAEKHSTPMKRMISSYEGAPSEINPDNNSRNLELFSVHDIANNSIYDIVNTPAYDIINSPTQNNVNTPAHDIINSPAQSIVNTPAHDFINSPAQSIVNTPAHDFINSPAQSIFNTHDNLNTPPVHNIVNNPAHSIVNTPLHDIINYPLHDIDNAPTFHDILTSPVNDVNNPESSTIQNVIDEMITKAEMHHTSSPDKSLESGHQVSDSDYTLEDDTAFDDDTVQLNPSKKAKKGKAGYTKWKQNLNQSRREKGLQYFGKTKDGETLKDARSLKPRCNCTLSGNRKCVEFTEEMRKSITEEFWGHMSWDQRHIFINSMVDKI